MSRNPYDSQEAAQEHRRTLVLQQAIDKHVLSIKDKITFFTAKLNAATKPADQSDYQEHLQALRACKAALEDPNDVAQKGLVTRQLESYRRKRGNALSQFFATAVGTDRTIIDHALESTAQLLGYSMRTGNEPFDSVVSLRSPR